MFVKNKLEGFGWCYPDEGKKNVRLVAHDLDMSIQELSLSLGMKKGTLSRLLKTDTTIVTGPIAYAIQVVYGYSAIWILKNTLPKKLLKCEHCQRGNN